MVLKTEALVTAQPFGLEGGAEEGAAELAAQGGALSQLISKQLGDVIENPLAGAVVVILAALLFGKLVDWVLRATLSVWVKNSDTPLDDLALKHLSGPIVKTTVLYGFWVATVHLELEEPSARLMVLRVIQTLLVLIWSVGVLHLVDGLLRYASSNKGKFKIVEKRKEPNPRPRNPGLTTKSEKYM